MDDHQPIQSGSMWSAKRTRAARRLGSLVFCGVLASVAWGAADSAGQPSGLKGLLPTEVPEALTKTISQLPENWQKWGETLLTDLTTLYGEGELDSAGQRKALSTLQGRLKVIQSALSDSRYGAINDQLVALRNGINRRIDVMTAVLDTLELDPAAAKTWQTNSSATRTVQAAAALEAYLRPIPNSAGWVKYFQADKIQAALRGGSNPDALALLQNVQTRLKGKKGLGDKTTQAFLSAQEFTVLEGAVDSYVSAAASQSEQVSVEDLRKELGTLLTSLEAYEASGTTANSTAVRQAFNALRKTAPDGGAKISRALQDNYFNYNLQIYASQGLLNRLISERHDEAGGVVDYVLGANVLGNQVTSTVAGVQLLPSSNGARFAVTLNGTVSSTTSGTTSQAVIYTQGNHSFYAQKEVRFDGNRFLTYPATISVNASNTTTGAQTNIRLPILNRVADNIAMREAEARRPESEAIAASRVSDRVVPRFNEEVDREFAKANTDLKKKVSGPLRDMHLYPDAFIYRSTPEQLSITTRLMDGKALAGSKPLAASVTANGLSVLVHQSLLNNSLDQLDLAGKTMTEADVQAMLKEKLRKLLGRDVKMAKAAQPAPAVAEDDAGPKALIFADADPIRVQFAGNEVLLTIRAGFKRDEKEDIPTQIVTVPLKFNVKGPIIEVTRGDISITPVNKPANVAEQVALAGVVRKKIESSMPARKLDSKFRLKRKAGDVDTTITQIKAVDGWLSLVMQ